MYKGSIVGFYIRGLHKSIRAPLKDWFQVIFRAALRYYRDPESQAPIALLLKGLGFRV